MKKVRSQRKHKYTIENSLVTTVLSMKIDYEHFGFYNHLETGHFLLKLATLNNPEEDMLLCIDLNNTVMPGDLSGRFYSEKEILPASEMALSKFADTKGLDELTLKMFKNRIPKFLEEFLPTLVENRIQTTNIDI